MRLSVFVAFVVALQGCVVGAKLREDAVAIDKKIASAMELGARRCAPAELATAQSHLEFLRYELEEGDYQRASFHREKSLTNVDRALQVTDPEKCADTRVLILNDRDGDGIADDIDQCPDEPEDIDGFEDENGCPDPDNDGDTVLDVDDGCPMVAGDPVNRGCPVEDRDGDGIPDEADQCPDIPEDIDGNEDEDGCPEDENMDQDGDGILDGQDKCPTEPEDMDLFEDEDGCPDVDNDLDTVLDVEDACPIEAGSPANQGCPSSDRDGDGVQDDVDQCPDVPGTKANGCPRRVLVVKTDTKIEIKKQINFVSGKADIRGRLSFEILDQVAAVMVSNPKLRIVIEGHTDDRGSADYNLRLSDDRANSVRDALIERGVGSSRMDAIGYGEAKPISSNRTRQGRAANRRVEFNIVQSDGPKPGG
ncbi:MAG: OmpA family protein [Myxococcota bacterium]